MVRASVLGVVHGGRNGLEALAGVNNGVGESRAGPGRNCHGKSEHQLKMGSKLFHFEDLKPRRGACLVPNTHR